VHGLDDVVVEPVAVARRSTMIAETMAAIRADAFAMTKRQLREPSLERIHDAAPRHDPGIIDAWAHPNTLRAIREYVERTFKKPG